MLNQSADYALRAVLFLAQHDGCTRCSAEHVADALGVPRNYLGKVLNTLASAGVLSSVRGQRGGFRLSAPPGDITLADVVTPFQKMPERTVCLRGNRPCSPSNPCESHRRWKQAADQLTGFFRQTTVRDMLEDPANAAAVISA